MENQIITGYCMRCKQKKEINNAKEIEIKAKGGKTKKAATGVCSVCGTKMFKFLPTKKEENILNVQQEPKVNPKIEEEADSFDEGKI